METKHGRSQRLEAVEAPARLIADTPAAKVAVVVEQILRESGNTGFNDRER